MGKALLVPLNSRNEIFIQDRRGYKKPDWGFFGGSIEEGETPTEAVLRETKEELDIDIFQEDILPLGELAMEGDSTERYFFLYSTDQREFNVLEGNAGYWMSFEKAREHLEKKERFDILITKIHQSKI